MAVMFNASRVQVPAVWRESYQSAIALAIEECRPAGEHWVVTLHETSDPRIVCVDFARGVEAPRSLSFVLDDDDGDAVEATALYRIVCEFLRKTWPVDIEPSVRQKQVCPGG